MWSWSTRAGSFRPPSRSRSTNCSAPPIPARPWSRPGCLAERYGSGLAEALPEAQVLSFDDYANIADRLDAVHAGPALGGA